MTEYKLVILDSNVSNIFFILTFLPVLFLLFIGDTENLKNVETFGKL